MADIAMVYPAHKPLPDHTFRKINDMGSKINAMEDMRRNHRLYRGEPVAATGGQEKTG